MSTLELDEIEGETALDASGLADDDQVQGGGDEAASDVAPEAAERQAEAEADAGELVVSIGDEQEQAEDEVKNAPGWIREVRKANREKDRRIRELERQLATSAPAQKPAAVGEKPTLESCDYDPERFAAEFQEWHARKVSADEQARQREREETKAREQWAGRMEAVSSAAKSLKVPDYDDAAAEVDDVFSPVQQGILIGGPDDPKSSALMRYALGKNPKKARELAAITDPVKFTFALAKLETQLKVTPRKSAPPPEQVVRSNVAGAKVFGAAQLEKLREEAQRSGDYSKYLGAKRAAKG